MLTIDLLCSYVAARKSEEYSFGFRYLAEGKAAGAKARPSAELGRHD